MMRAVYRGNGIPLPWRNMSLLPDPCPQWAVFRLLKAVPANAGAEALLLPLPAHPGASVGIDLAPALAAQSHDGRRG